MTARPLPRFATILAATALFAATATAAAAKAAPPQLRPFTATYQVLRNGSVIGQSTLKLTHEPDGTWRFASKMHGTHGLAALLGATVNEMSTFRWKDNRPEALTYDYSMDASVKSQHRHMTVNWQADRVHMMQNGKTETYAPKAGLLERHTVPLALALKVEQGETRIALPVAVRDRVQMQRFQVMGKEKLSVPAGSFKTVKVERTDRAKSFTAWYAPGRMLAPVEMAQDGGGHISLKLESFKAD